MGGGSKGDVGLGCFGVVGGVGRGGGGLRGRREGEKEKADEEGKEIAFVGVVVDTGERRKKRKKKKKQMETRRREEKEKEKKKGKKKIIKKENALSAPFPLFSPYSSHPQNPLVVSLYTSYLSSVFDVLFPFLCCVIILSLCVCVCVCVCMPPSLSLSALFVFSYLFFSLFPLFFTF